MERKLTKSNDSCICGVCGGIAEYLDIDPTIVRLMVFIALCSSEGAVVFLYCIAAMIMPSKDEI